jgi:hypothetical protein
MLHRLYYLAVSPQVYRRSRLKQPRACACVGFTFLAIILISIALFFVDEEIRTILVFTEIGLAIAFFTISGKLGAGQLQVFLDYLRGNEQEFWEFTTSPASDDPQQPPSP